MDHFSIKDIENLTGIKAHTIRIWEQRYGILQPKRTPTNIRYYDALDLKQALRIALLNDYGYKISHIHKMTEEDIDALIHKNSDQDFRLQLLVNELLEAMLDMDTDQFELLLNGYIRKYGLENAIEQLLFHFLNKVGLMWVTRRTSTAQEHLVSNIIYRKLAAGIEGLPPKKPNAGPGILLFLPEGEIHDISLLYVHYLLLKHGKAPVYLGPNSPIGEVATIAALKQTEYLFLHLTSVTGDFNIARYLNKLTTMLPNKQIFVSGSMLRHAKLPQFPNVRMFYTLDDAKKALITL